MPSDASPLTARDRAILEFEGGTWWRAEGRKIQAIRDRFGLSATRYYQVLNALVDDPAAAAAEPTLIGRLQRIRTEHQRVGTRRLAS